MPSPAAVTEIFNPAVPDVPASDRENAGPPVIFTIATPEGGTTSSGNSAFVGDHILITGLNLAGGFVYFGPQSAIQILVQFQLQTPLSVMSQIRSGQVISDTATQILVAVPDPPPQGVTKVVSIVVQNDAFGFGMSTNTVYQGFTILSDFLAWDPSTASQVTLSDNNLAVTNAAAGLEVIMGVQGPALAAQNSGKYYYEMTWNPVASTGTNGGIAFGPTGTDYMDLSDGQNGSCPGGVLLTTGGFIEFYGTVSSLYVIGPGSGMHSGDIIGVAVDLDNRAIWFKCVGGPDYPANDWNGTFGNNPATNTGGVALTAGSSIFYIPFVTYEQDSVVGGNTITANFSGSQGGEFFAGSPPNGFVNWPSR